MPVVRDVFLPLAVVLGQSERWRRLDREASVARFCGFAGHLPGVGLSQGAPIQSEARQIFAQAVRVVGDLLLLARDCKQFAPGF